MDTRLKSIMAVAVWGTLMLTAPALAQGTPRASAYSKVAQWPDWTGVWSPAGRGRGRTPPTPPKLTPAAQKIMDAYNAAKTKGENVQTDAANCVPYGMPRIMGEPYPIEFIYSPGRVNIIIETESQVRRIYLGKQLPEDPDPFFNGHSVGHWEGDTLVVDTNGVTPAVFVIDGLRATEKTQFHERISRTGDIITDQISVTDPGLFTEPYVLTDSYALKPDWEMREYVCQENNHDGADEKGRASMSLKDPFADLDKP